MKGCRGENHKCAKLKEADIRYVRSSPWSNALLAAELGVTPTTIASIRKRKLWKHI